MKKGSRIVISSIAVSIALSIAALFLPTPATWMSGWFLFHIMMVIVIIYMCLHVGTVVLFLTSLQKYKTGLRRAYVAIATAIVLLALSTIQIALISIFNWWDSIWVSYGFVVIPYLAAGLVSYIGTRSLAHLVSVRSYFARSIIMVPIITALSLLIIPAPHIPSSTPEVIYDASNVLLAWTTLMYFAAGLVVLAVMRHTGKHYKGTIVWLAGGFVTASVLLGAALIHSLFSNETQDAAGIAIDLIGLLSAALFLRAGYLFAKSVAGTITTVRDMVQYAASLASNPTDIAPLLSQVRTMTESLQPNEAPSLADNQRLIVIYLQIEQYLLTQEPLRTYTKGELRSHFNPILQEMLNQREDKR